MEKFAPLEQYRLGSVVASGLAVACAVYGVFIPASVVTALLFSVSAGLLYFLWTRPVIEVNDVCLTVGGQTIRWYEIVAVETTGWHSPLVVKLKLDDERTIRLIHPGDVRSAERLLQRIRRNARDATIDGEPYAEFWGEVALIRADTEACQSARPRLLREEDEAEVEEIFWHLRSADQADRTTSTDDSTEA